MGDEQARISVVVAVGLALLALLAVVVLVVWDRAREREARKAIERLREDRADARSGRICAAILNDSAARIAAEERRLFNVRAMRGSES